MAGFLAAGPTRAVVFIGAVDTVGRMASGTFADGSECGNIINTAYPVGTVQVTPSVGEGWMVERNGTDWLLVAKLPAHILELSGITRPVEGQTQLGGKGPLELFGSRINAHGPLGLATTTTAARPSAAEVGAGTVLYDLDVDAIISSDGTSWSEAGAGGGGGVVGLAGHSVFAEALVGTKNGVNLAFTTTQTFVATSVALFRNGMRERLGVSYTETTPNTITFTTAPLSGDDLIVDYLGPTDPTGTAIFGEVPSGTRNGVNVTFATAHPYLAGTLAVYRNALRESPANYTESGPTGLVFATAPLSSDDVTVDYLISA